MASDVAIGGFTSGTGSRSINFGLGALSFIEADYGGTGNKHAKGFMFGGQQATIPDENASPIANKFLQIKNSGGTIVFEATYTGMTGSSANFTVATNTIGSVTCLFRFGN